MNILIIEDDITIGDSLLHLLNNEGYFTSLVGNCRKALEILSEKEFNLIILDLTLPDGNGFDLYTNIKEHSMAPIIFLTALDDEINIVRGLDLGAEDYITKPFKVRELLSRIKNILRRNDFTNSDIIKINDLVINTKQGKVTKNNHDVFLTALEYKILLILITNRNQILTREQILADIWDCDLAYVNDNTLTVYIKRIREKIEEDINNPKIILTVRGLGYKANI
ncbi:MAG: response regulator transcription factor [Bacilli bacterium]